METAPSMTASVKFVQNSTGLQASIAQITMEKLWDRNNKNRTSREKFSAGLSNLHSTCPEEHFGNFREKIHFFRKIGKKISDFEQKIFSRVVKFAFYTARETFWEKKIHNFLSDFE